MENTVRNLMFDLAFDRDIYDDDKKISKAEANDTLRNACYDLLGVNAQSTEKQIKRALKSEKATEFFEVIEEIIEQEIQYGFQRKAYNIFREMQMVIELISGQMRTSFLTLPRLQVTFMITPYSV